MPIDDYEEMLEEFHFGAAVRESELARPFDKVIAEFRENGEIDV